MYLEHFKLEKLPFNLTPDTSFFCDLSGYQAALNVLLFSIKSGEGFIKLIAEVGTGKTMLCRLLLNELEGEVITAYIPNPDLNPMGLRKALAKELGIEASFYNDNVALMTVITERLLKEHAAGNRVVLIIDEAQALSDESLETLRLMTNLETETERLLQIVLFAQPELDERLDQYHFRQFRQRITFSHYLSPLSREELDAYLTHRLVVAGNSKGNLFSTQAKESLFKFSSGIPRVINIICHKALLVAYGQGKKQVDTDAMQRAIADSGHLAVKAPPKQKKQATEKPRKKTLWGVVSALGVVAAVAVGLVVVRHFGLLAV